MTTAVLAAAPPAPPNPKHHRLGKALVVLLLLALAALAAGWYYTGGDLAARWQEDVIDLRPDVLSVFVGTNDAERHLGRLLRADDPKTVPDFDFADWERTYRGLLDRARQANPALKIVLCTPFAAPCGKIVEGALGEYYPLRQRILAQCCVIVERIAADYGATLVPFHRLIADLETRLPNGDATYWVWDGIHPTPAGQRLMADCWIGAAARNGVME